MTRAFKIIQLTTTTQITPLAYLFALLQLVYGANQLFPDEHGGGITLLSVIDPLVPAPWWGLAMCFACVSMIVGMLIENVNTIKVGSIIGFCCWIMAAISYGTHGYIWLHVPTALILALMFGYFYLAAGLHQLWNYTPKRP